MSDYDDLKPPAKRNVKGLTAFLDDLEPDDSVVATLATDRYGVFVLRGEAKYSQVMAAYAIGGHALDSNKKPSRPLQLARTFHSAERDEAGAAADSPDARPSTVDVAHGDLVRATFEEEAYGRFDVTGVAVRSAVDESILVGGWIVATGGAVAPRAMAVEVLERAAGHDLAVPREITTWGAEAGAEV